MLGEETLIYTIFARAIVIVYAHGRRLCSNRFRHGSTTISYPQCSLTFLRERYLYVCREHMVQNGGSEEMAVRVSAQPPGRWGGADKG